ncbi:hypothetical protein K474DRAFT_948173 [Panus rudis PR-1116 ss-1]|nr:hypothetical protein K474DRAFT_948173 [Panus rudis PR-1116 ss-1]
MQLSSTRWSEYQPAPTCKYVSMRETLRMYIVVAGRRLHTFPNANAETYAAIQLRDVLQTPSDRLLTANGSVLAQDPRKYPKMSFGIFAFFLRTPSGRILGNPNDMPGLGNFSRDQFINVLLKSNFLDFFRELTFPLPRGPPGSPGPLSTQLGCVSGRGCTTVCTKSIQRC